MNGVVIRYILVLVSVRVKNCNVNEAYTCSSSLRVCHHELPFNVPWERGKAQILTLCNRCGDSFALFSL